MLKIAYLIFKCFWLCDGQTERQTSDSMWYMHYSRVEVITITTTVLSVQRCSVLII